MTALVAVTALVAIPATTLKVSASTIVNPTFVRTIGGPNGEAIAYPSGVAVDTAGNVYVADTGNYKVEKWAAGTGTPTPPVWSVGVRGEPIGPVTDSFQAPRDVTVDPAAGSNPDGQYVYVADTDDSAVQVLRASDGSFVKEVTSFGPNNSTSFSDPIGIGVGTDGPPGNEIILVSDGVTGSVYVFDRSFVLLRTIKGTATNEGTRDASTDSQGNIYTADYRGHKVDVYYPNNNGPTPNLTWGSATPSDCHDVAHPYGVQIDTADTPNRVYVASSDLEQIRVFDTNGNCLNVGATGSNAIGSKTTSSADSTKIFQLRRVAVGAGSNPLIYAADLWGLKILTFNSSDGSLASTAQPEIGDGQYPPAGNLNEPHGLAIDPADGYLFTTNTINQRMERFNLDGTQPTDWGIKGIAESTSAFNWPQGVGYDAANGNVWVANTRNHRIDQFTTSGTKVSSFPGGTRLSSIFNWPMAVAFDPAGTMYVADTYHNRVAAFSVSGTTVNPTERWETTKSTLNKPWSLVYDTTQNRLLVADTGHSRIVSLNPADGTASVIINSAGSAPGNVTKPEGVTVDAVGNIWVADTGNNRVEEFLPSGAFANQLVGSFGTTGDYALNAPQGIGFGPGSTPEGLLYVADPNNNRIQVFQPQPASGGGGGGGNAPSHLHDIFNAGGVGPMYPAGGVADANNDTYIADSGGSRIDKIDASGNLTYISSPGSLSNPRHLSLDVADTNALWVTDTGNNQLWEMSKSGQTLQRYGGSTGLSLSSPFGNANDAAFVYLADTYHHRVVAVKKADGSQPWSTTTCLTSNLSRVRDLTMGSDGNLYAADTDNNRIVVLNPTNGTCLGAWSGSGPGALSQPRAVSSDGAGGLWIADDGSTATILHYSNDGTTLYGSTSDGGALLAPEGVFLNNQQQLVVADPFKYQLVTFSVDGSGVPSAMHTSIDNRGAPVVGGFNNPFGVAYAPNGDMFVTDMFNQRLEKYSPTTQTWTATGQFGGAKGNMQNPRGISVKPDGSQVILTNSEDERLDLFDATTLVPKFVQSIVPTCGKMYFPHQAAYDAVADTYWIADTNNNRILEVGAAGNCLQNWSGTSSLPIVAPRGIAWDGTSVWVSNTKAGQVLKCTTSGSCQVVAARTGTSTKVTGPWNLTFVQATSQNKMQDSIWIADASAATIVVIDLNGTALYTLGSPGTASGQFVDPRAVAVSSTGQVAVADFAANQISLWQ